MTLPSTLALAVAILVLAATPGPGVFATVSRALASGFSQALCVVAGIVLGDLLFLMLAIFGLAVVAGALGEMFFVVRLLGGAYLIWLGLRIWRSNPAPPENGQAADRRSGWQNFVGGLVITLGNPKAIVFYMGFLPTFMDLSTLSAADVEIVALVVALVLGWVMAAYAYLASSARRLFARPAAIRVLNRSAGTVMIGTGLVIASR